MSDLEGASIVVIGAGSSGLVTLKYLMDEFPAEQIICFEKSDSIRGCWGDQSEEFVSTSTKYTTQFSCHRTLNTASCVSHQYQEFYRGKEYGDYLEDFAEKFDLKRLIQFETKLISAKHGLEGWTINLDSPRGQIKKVFKALFICTGLVNKKREIETSNKNIKITSNYLKVKNSKVVIIGGGESAVDIANKLAKEELNNKVSLSLRSGVRVSPRYHPIRGVPSDFLRNRLLLSVDKRIRNWIGEGFVTFRIRHKKILEKLFPNKSNSDHSQVSGSCQNWELKLKQKSKNDLFNVFHNKSDQFLKAVSEGRINIIGPETDSSFKIFYDFDQEKQTTVEPEVIIPSTGYYSNLKSISNGSMKIKDFYLGCLSTTLPNTFIIGFARPVIGNIPTISEMQAQYCTGILKRIYKIPKDIKEKQEKDWKDLEGEYPSIKISNVYPVEHYPYCDVLAKHMGTYPSLLKLRSLKLWLKILLIPASTTHYLDQNFDREALKEQVVFTPTFLILLLVIIRIIELPFKMLKFLF